MLLYKIDVLQELKNKGYSTYRIKKDKLLPEWSLQNFRKGTPVPIKTLDKLCSLLQCQPSDIIYYAPDEE